MPGMTLNRRGNPQEYIRRLEGELELTDKWRKEIAQSPEEKEELEKEWMFFDKLLTAARRLAKQHGKWQH
jgi:hypothetical protein